MDWDVYAYCVRPSGDIDGNDNDGIGGSYGKSPSSISGYIYAYYIGRNGDAISGGTSISVTYSYGLRTRAMTIFQTIEIFQ